MARPRGGSLAGRLVVTYAVAIVVVLGVVGFAVERAARDVLLDTVEEGMVSQARAVASVMPDGTSDIEALVETVAERVDSRITVIGADGWVVADSLADAETMENHGLRPEVAAAAEGGTGIDRRLSVSTGFRQLYVAVPAGELIVRVSLPAAVVDAGVGAFRNRLLLLLAGVVVIGILIVVVAARLLARPIVKLTRAAGAIERGEVGIMVPRSPVTELDRLGRSIESMSIELGRRLGEVGDQRRTLGVVLDAIPQGTLLIDTDDVVIYANRSLFEVLGPVPTTLDQVVPFRIQEMVRRAREGGVALDIDMEHGRPVRILRIIASPLEDGRVLVVVSDVTGRRRVDDVRRDFVTNASHELKTPVASILASAEALQLASQKAPERVPQFADQIENAAHALSRLVSDLLDLSRLESASPATDQIDLAEVAVSEGERIRPRATERGVDLTVETQTVSVSGSAADLGLAVRNLLDNAVRFTDEGGSLTLRTGAEGDDAVLSVTDTGTGIPQRDLERVFERFYRVDVARSRATGGTGLGLSIVRHVVENHGGRVTVESELGNGSTFTIRLPALV